MFLSILTTAVTTGALAVVRAVASVNVFFLRLLRRLFLLLIAALPATGCVFLCLYLYHVLGALLGHDPLRGLTLPVSLPYEDAVTIYTLLSAWWHTRFSALVHPAMQAAFCILTLALAVPVLGTLLLLPAFLTGQRWWVFLAAFDLACYLLRLLFGRVSPVRQFMGRYRR